MGRVAFASFIGTAIEFYDFYIYGRAAALASATVSVPEGIAGSGVAQLLTYAGFAVAFVARPVGGAVFGHFGDRVGRKTMLIFSLLLMGLAMFLGHLRDAGGGAGPPRREGLRPEIGGTGGGRNSRANLR
ncbi:MAG TPA: MFS transporter [Rubrobacter sp.]|nr:MFS transporter [Rubrobacter sp.]